MLIYKLEVDRYNGTGPVRVQPARASAPSPPYECGNLSNAAFQRGDTYDDGVLQVKFGRKRGQRLRRRGKPEAVARSASRARSRGGTQLVEEIAGSRSSGYGDCPAIAYTPWRSRWNLGLSPETPAASAAFTAVHRSGLPASCSAAAWISRARIGSPVPSSTRVAVSSTGVDLAGAGRGCRRFAESVYVKLCDRGPAGTTISGLVTPVEPCETGEGPGTWVIHPGSVGGSVRWRPPLGCCLS